MVCYTSFMIRVFVTVECVQYMSDIYWNSNYLIIDNSNGWIKTSVQVSLCFLLCLDNYWFSEFILLFIDFDVYQNYQTN